MLQGASACLDLLHWRMTFPSLTGRLEIPIAAESNGQESLPSGLQATRNHLSSDRTLAKSPIVRILGSTDTSFEGVVEEKKKRMLSFLLARQRAGGFRVRGICCISLNAMHSFVFKDMR